MKKGFIITIMLVLVASAAFAADFEPTLLKLDAEETISYGFEGATLAIPFTVTGTPANVVFMVYTKGMAASINNVNNGYLGWHTVNKIDTCVYMSQEGAFDTGSNEITWAGVDNDGGQVDAAELTYYMFAYDPSSAKTFASPMGSMQMGFNVQTITEDFEGNQLARPVLVGAKRNLADGVSPSGEIEGDVFRQKWILGSDPTDLGLFETSAYTCFHSINTFTPSPYEADAWFDFTTTDALVGRIRKWNWVPNGNATRDVDWGDEGEFVYGISTGTGWWVALQDMVYVGGDLLAATNTDHSGASSEAELVMVDATDGT